MILHFLHIGGSSRYFGVYSVGESIGAAGGEEETGGEEKRIRIFVWLLGRRNHGVFLSIRPTKAKDSWVCQYIFQYSEFGLSAELINFSFSISNSIPPVFEK